MNLVHVLVSICTFSPNQCMHYLGTAPGHQMRLQDWSVKRVYFQCGQRAVCFGRNLLVFSYCRSVPRCCHSDFLQCLLGDTVVFMHFFPMDLAFYSCQCGLLTSEHCWTNACWIEFYHPFLVSPSMPGCASAEVSEGSDFPPQSGIIALALMRPGFQKWKYFDFSNGKHLSCLGRLGRNIHWNRKHQRGFDQISKYLQQLWIWTIVP